MLNATETKIKTKPNPNPKRRVFAGSPYRALPRLHDLPSSDSRDAYTYVHTYIQMYMHAYKHMCIYMYISYISM